MGTTVTNKNGIEFDIDALATDVNGKLDRDCLNYSATGASVMGSMAMPSDKYIDLTLGASGATYTAPADGYYYLRKQATAAGQAFEVGKTDGLYTVTNTAGVNQNWCSDIIPVKKGDIIYISYTLAGTTAAFRFIYAVGSEPEA